MSQQTNAKELFLPLGERLFYYESKEYINAAPVYIESYNGYYEDYFNTHKAKVLIDIIGVSANRFDPKTIHDEAVSYLARVETVFNTLKYTEYEFIRYEQVDPIYEMDGLVKVPDEKKEKLLQRHRDELNIYKQGLEAIIEVREQFVTHVHSANTSEESNLYEKTPVIIIGDFNVKNLQKSFDARMSADQIALLFHYLVRIKVSPNLSQTRFGTIAERLFARNEKEVQDALGRVGTTMNDKEALIKLQKILGEILQEIDNDIDPKKRK